MANKESGRIDGKMFPLIGIAVYLGSLLFSFLVSVGVVRVLSTFVNGDLVIAQILIAVMLALMTTRLANKVIDYSY